MPWRRVFERQVHSARRHPVVSLVVVAAFARVLYVGVAGHQVKHAIGYLLAVWLGALVTDLVAPNSSSAAEFPIHHSAAQEAAVIVGFTLVGFIGLLIRFGTNWSDVHGPARLAVTSVMLLFMFPVGLALAYLFAYRYKPSQLGLNFRCWYLPVPVLVIFASIALTIAPSGIL